MLEFPCGLTTSLHFHSPTPELFRPALQYSQPWNFTFRPQTITPPQQLLIDFKDTSVLYALIPLLIYKNGLRSLFIILIPIEKTDFMLLQGSNLYLNRHVNTVWGKNSLATAELTHCFILICSSEVTMLALFVVLLLFYVIISFCTTYKHPLALKFHNITFPL